MSATAAIAHLCGFPLFFLLFILRVLLLLRPQLRDLLMDDTQPVQRLEIRTSGTPGMGTNVLVPHLTRLEVFTAAQALAVYEQGCSVRSVAATNVHEHSSRSHSVVIIEVVGTCVGPAACYCLLLVAIAGYCNCRSEFFRIHSPCSWGPVNLETTLFPFFSCLRLC